ncbi:MAG: hypothetical protein K5657_10560 [Desulfovibrio sp.]|nr:hypothetical protein [Desulfovibrio sp.]
MNRRDFLRSTSILTVGIGFLCAGGCVAMTGKTGGISKAHGSAAAREIIKHLEATDSLFGLQDSSSTSASQGQNLDKVVSPNSRDTTSAKTRRKGKGRSEGSTVRAVNGGFVIAPGEAMEFHLKGFCMDPDRPVPARGEPFAMRPIADYLSSNKRELLTDSLHYAGTHRTDADLQKIVWAIRTADESDSSWIDGLGEKEYDFLDKARPGGAKQLKAMRSGWKTKKKSSEFSMSEFLNLLLPALSHVDTSGSSDNVIALLTRLSPMGGTPEIINAYSMPAPGVAVKAVGRGLLEVDVVIANTSSEPFHFTAQEWVMEPSREVQRVALLPPEKGIIRAAAN